MNNPGATTDNVVQLPQSQDERSASSFTTFARENPGLVVAGGLVVGALAGAFLSRGSGRKLAARAVTLAEIAGTASLAFGRDALERAEEAGEVIRQKGGELSERASGALRHGGEAVSEKAGRLPAAAEDAYDSAHDAAANLLRRALEIAGRLRG